VEAVPRELIKALQVRTGRRSRAAKGAKVGALVWLAYSALVFATRPDESGVVSPQAFIALGVSAGIGAGIGEIASTDEWKEAPLTFPWVEATLDAAVR
jgi:hypothetical protein